MNAQDLVKHLQIEVLDYIGRLRFVPIGQGRTGLFSIARSCLTICDYLGQLRYGVDKNKTTERAVKFIEEYLGSINQRWKDVAGAIYTIFRHGTVHHIFPKSYDLRGQSLKNIPRDYLGWVITNDPAWHLVLMPHNSVSDTMLIFLSSSSLINEMEIAIQQYIDEIQKDTSGKYSADIGNFEEFAAPQKPTQTVVNLLRKL